MPAYLRRATTAAYPGRKPKITAEHKNEIVEAVTCERKTSAEIARLFKLYPATVSRVLAQTRVRV